MSHIVGEKSHCARLLEDENLFSSLTFCKEKNKCFGFIIEHIDEVKFGTENIG